MSIIEKAEKTAKKVVVGAVCDILEKNPEDNIGKIFTLVKKLSTDEASMKSIEDIESDYNQVPSTKEYIDRILKDTNKNCLKKFFQNFLADAVWTGIPQREKWMKKEDTKIPFVLLISPSMKCNLRCTGCYAAAYDKGDGLSYEEVDKIVSEARTLGIHFIIILGGEPFFVDFMYKIYEKYSDIEFMPFTNGTLFNEEVSEKLVKLGNVMPMFSLEGFEEETDGRRGKGTFNKVMNGMDLLKNKGIPFGVSSATTRFNMDTVTSKKFINMLIEKGSKMSWYFMYMPVGDTPNIDLMLTPEQRIELGRRNRNIRETMPYFTIDFFNDAPYVGGCIAGKYYCHINSKGDVEPCIFAHIAVDNAKDKSLIDIFRGTMFKELRKRQPYNKNMLRPCMMIDNPHVIREVAKVSNAHPTDISAKAMLDNPEFQKKLEKYSEDFKPYADEAWKNDFNSQGNDEFSKG
ncbi:Radical SAM superfamily enzyme, MoaA/NifB/PqqE/SkfB family [Clostridium cavendishii DSM 21758]|uniref:Radical SAM superfamily enzyme, MoaA/NifB/PqqE/SkfB family n=1 Tax=Clostridium cavendishii DSM 21758 TaxID=1121302 RepID=A0A1M6EV97_9CLOT|nr:radical SAM protein [Clostridium cavendishii]SHI89355.1 Radical SAM superfamily enzyme, MoaA/NifB/PqqE/SkfB family [Clostridium cavendishii DSM 21758]